MEVLQKKIYQITKVVITGGTGSTKVIPQNGDYTKPIDVYLGWTGDTGGTGYTKIPDTGVTYNLKICLTQETEDIGFFDAYIITEQVIPPVPIVIDTNNYIDYDEVVFTDNDGSEFI